MRKVGLILVAVAAGCGGSDSRQSSASGSSGVTLGSAGSSGASQGTGTGATTSLDAGTSNATSADDGHTKLDVLGEGDIGVPPVDMCKVVDDMDAVGDCSDEAPPDSFEPDVQWTFTVLRAEPSGIVTPLVANLTDDNGDGAIDLCDMPDVVRGRAASAPAARQPQGHIYVLDGETGTARTSRSPTGQRQLSRPALGDIDGDGLPEIVTLRSTGCAGRVRARRHAEVGAGHRPAWPSVAGLAVAIALADLDNDGDVEIIAAQRDLRPPRQPAVDASRTCPATGRPPPPPTSTATATSRSSSGDAAYHHDGTLLLDTPGSRRRLPAGRRPRRRPASPRCW